MPRVSIPPPYRGPTQGEAEVKVEGGTVRDCLEAMEARYPGFLAQVMTEAGEVHRFVRLFVNGRLIDPAALDTAVGRDDEVRVLAAIAGG